MDKQQVVPSQLKKSSISPLWLFTLIAVILTGWLLYKSVKDAGQNITIHFQNAQGIEAGRTAIRYQGLDIGVINKINLANDLKGVDAQAEIYDQAKKLLNKDTIFWIVRPKASLTGISGLDTLVSGNYIAIKPGTSDEFDDNFIAVEDPPNFESNQQGLNVHLISTELNSINIGSGVYFRKIQVGEVIDFALKEDGQGVLITLKIKPKYEKLVKDNSRFWNVSGLSASLDGQGFQLNFNSLSSLLAGGVAFDSPENGKPASNLKTYTLYSSINDTERGIDINITLPLNHGIKNNQASIYYLGTEVGRLQSIELNENHSGFVAKANIDPSMKWLLTSNSKFIIEEPVINLAKQKNISNLLFGNTLSIKPEKGEYSTQFVAKTPNESLAQNINSLKIRLEAKDIWGISTSTQVLFNGVEVGFVEKTAFENSKIFVDLIIYPNYKHLVKSQSRFYRLSGINAQLGFDEVNISVAPMAQLAQSAISFTSLGEQKISKKYFLFDSKNQADKAKNIKSGITKLSLVSDSLPSISVGSPVMYKNFSVGKVADFVLEKDKIKVDILIENHYKHLITNKTVFWDQSGIDIQAGINGINVQAGNFRSLVSGGIAFDNIRGVQSKKGLSWILYKNLKEVQNQGSRINLMADTSFGLNIGSEIRYLGIKVGEIIKLTPSFDKESVHFEAIILPEYAENIAREKSYFWLAKPTINQNNINNLDAVIIPFISVKPGRGKRSDKFILNQSPYYDKGLVLTLESNKRDSVTVGTPILFREFEVGTVTNVRLGDFSDRVLVEITIADKYKYLVRRNSVFWNASGFDMSLGLTGADIKTGTFESMLRGGISFATPEGKKLENMASNGQHFLLHAQAKEEWRKWVTAIPSPTK